MKIMLSILTLIGMLSANTNTKKMASELNYLVTEDPQCNLYLEYATNSLYLMAEAEKQNNPKFIKIHFDNFTANAEIAIDYCKHVNKEITGEINDIYSTMKSYYNR